jgi:hypothetical protein
VLHRKVHGITSWNRGSLAKYDPADRAGKQRFPGPDVLYGLKILGGARRWPPGISPAVASEIP